MHKSKKLIQILVAPALLGMVMVLPAQATAVLDNYVGGNDHNGKYGVDVIGKTSIFDIQSMDVTVSGTMLNVSVKTNFAGNAGVDSDLVTKGIGYGDLFLSSSWNPYGSASNGYLYDSASNGTKWTYAVSLDNRWSNSGGVATLYSLTTSDNSDVLTSDHFIDCGSSCIFRNGQAVAADTANNDFVHQIDTGSWTVDTTNNTVNFSIDLAGTQGLLGSTGMGVRWEMTCANDAIEGSVSAVPLPAGVWLFASGLFGLVGLARRKNS